MGRMIEPSVLQDVAKLISEDLDPDSDIHATAAYRKEVGGGIARRSLEAAINRRPGGN